MEHITPHLILLFLGYATGIFYVLSMIEKPIWKYMYTSKIFPSEDLMRQIHAQLKRVITLLPPTMATAMFSSLGLIIYQYVSLKTTSSLILLIFFVVQLLRLVVLLKGRIAGVQNITSDEEYPILNKGVIKLAQLHHEGMLMTVTSFLLQICVVLG
jgi:hypothetical protein